MSKHMLYIYGEPGVGKSTLVTALIGQAEPETTTEPFAWARFDNGVSYIGAFREEFPGTDALALDVQPKVIAWLESYGPHLVLAEGDRLANAKFFLGAQRLGYTLWPVQMVGKDLAAQRRRERAQALGRKPQDAQWVRGRVTKCNALTKNFDAMQLHPSLEPEFLAKMLPGPVAAAFR